MKLTADTNLSEWDFGTFFQVFVEHTNSESGSSVPCFALYITLIQK